MDRGAIFAPEAYARGKMLDHSGWAGILPRKITPSDVDAVIDSNGRQLLWELSSRSPAWADLKFGQRYLYENLVKSGKGRIVAACVHHRQPDEGQPIDTVEDVLAFQGMFYVSGGVKVTTVLPADRWVTFVEMMVA